MTTLAGQMSNVAQPNPQWVPANGKFYFGYAPFLAAPRPHTAPSTGTIRDYWRNTMGFQTRCTRGR